MVVAVVRDAADGAQRRVRVAGAADRRGSGKKWPCSSEAIMMVVGGECARIIVARTAA